MPELSNQNVSADVGVDAWGDSTPMTFVEMVAHLPNRVPEFAKKRETRCQVWGSDMRNQVPDFANARRGGGGVAATQN